MPSRFAQNDRRSCGIWRIALSLVIAGQAMLLSLGLNTTDEPPAFASGWYMALHGVLVLSVLVTLFLLGGPLFRNFFGALRRRVLTVEALFVVSLMGALLVSLQSTLTGIGPLYYEVVAVVLIIYTFGNSLRARAFDEAQKILTQARASYATAWLQKDGRQISTPVADIHVDDLVVIHPGEMSTVDGVITQGQAFVTLASLTGEPAAVAMKPGDHLPAGAFSTDGLLTVRVTSLARSIDDILTRLSAGAPSAYEQLADRVTRWFLPIVGTVAALTFAAWSFFAGVGPAITASMSVLLVACPCAIGMATPLAVQSFLFALSRYGWRGRSGQLIERLARVDAIFFDKTGTLTLADLKIAGAAWGPSFDPNKMQGLVALAEHAVPQPIARAFAEWSPLPGATLVSLRVHPGEGISAEILFQEKTHRLVVGQLSFAAAASSGAWPSAPSAKRQVWVALDGLRAGVVSLQEVARPQMYALLQKLLAENYRIEILTGDADPQVNFPEGVKIHAGMKPADKAAHVRAAQGQGSRVLFVGDGLNDTLAMNEASCSVAVEEGSALSHAAATAVVGCTGIEALPSALTLSQKASAALAWNLQFAAVYNFLGIGLAAIGWLHPVLASLLMLASSILVAVRAMTAVQE